MKDRYHEKLRIEFTYPLSETELKYYLEEQEKIDEEDLAFGCRIHSVACLKVKDLEYLNGGSMMFLPDTKTGTRDVEVDSNSQKKGCFDMHAY